MTRSIDWQHGLRMLAVLALLVAAAFPLYWMLVTSLTPSADLFAAQPRMLPNPDQLTIYEEVFTTIPVATWLANSAIVATGTMALSIALAILPAYALSRFRFRGKGLLGFGLFATQMLPGIAIAVALSILNVFRRVWMPYQTTLGVAEGVAGYHDVRSYPDARLLPGLVIFRFDAPLIFANANTFQEEVLKLARSEPPPQWVVIAAEPITDVDTTASDMLQELDAWLNEREVSLVFAEMKDPVREKIERYELTRTIDPAHFFRTVDEAVAEYVRQTGATWRNAGTTP